MNKNSRVFFLITIVITTLLSISALSPASYQTISVDLSSTPTSSPTATPSPEESPTDTPSDFSTETAAPTQEILLTPTADPTTELSTSNYTYTPTPYVTSTIFLPPTSTPILTQISNEALIKAAAEIALEQSSYSYSPEEIRVRGYDAKWGVAFLSEHEGVIILLQKFENWAATLPDNAEDYNRILDLIPKNLISPDEKIYYRVPAVVSLASQSQPEGSSLSALSATNSEAAGYYYFPWVYGETGSVTQSPFPKFFSHKQNEIDFSLSSGNIAAIKDGIVKYAKDSSNVQCEYNKSDGKYYRVGTNYKTLCRADDANLIVLYHPDDDTYSFYLHLAYSSIPDYIQKVGSIVHHGQIIGTQGRTGLSTANHLHFALSVDMTAPTTSYKLPWYKTLVSTQFKNGSDTIPYSELEDGDNPRYPRYSAKVGNTICNNYRIAQNSKFYNKGVTLFAEVNCKDTKTGHKKIEFMSPSAWVDLSSLGFNDMASSASVTPGWSVLVWEHNIASSVQSGLTTVSSRCISSTITDFAKNNFTTGNTVLTLNDKISSIQVFDTPNCTPRTIAIRSLQTNGSGKFYCLEVASSSTVDGAKAQIYECNGRSGQLWKKSNLDDFLMLSNVNSRKCLDVPGGKTWLVTPLQMQQWTCVTNNTNQMWTSINKTANYFMLQNKTNSWCLAIEKSPANGVRVIQRKCTSNDITQKWTIFGEQ